MIEFENVSFSYTGQEHGGLRDINLKISDGECVLFCGRSGCGKTTISIVVLGTPKEWNVSRRNFTPTSFFSFLWAAAALW